MANITTSPGIILTINGTDVPLALNGLISDFSKNGISYTMPNPVTVGSAADLSAFLTSQFGAPALPASTSFPTPLDSVYAKLTSLSLAVDQFSVTVPPTKDANGNALSAAQQRATSFDLGLSATWADGSTISLISGKLAIKGIYLHITKDDSP